MSTTSKYIIVLAIILLLGIFFIYYKNKNTDLDCLNLPMSADPQVFGPSYWAAFHNLAHRIPCTKCRTIAEKFMVFFHDVVNKKLGKPVFDQQNYNEVLQQIIELK